MAVKHWKRSLSALLIASVALLPSGCADLTNPDRANVEAERVTPIDPWEPFNRGMFELNTTIDGLVVKPLTQIYRGVVPQEGRDAVTNVLRNLGAPVNLVNSVLQGDVQNSFAVFWRFVLNSTFGLAGIRDFAGEDAQLYARNADFGQTLAVLGVPSGPYTFMPFFGPGTTRDTVGRIVDILMNPFSYADVPWPPIYTTVTVLDRRSVNMSLIDDVFRDSLDPYATFRSGYLQRRASEIKKARKASAWTDYYAISSRDVALPAKKTLGGNKASKKPKS